MIIDLKAIPREGSRSFEFELGKDWWSSDLNNDLVIGFNKPLTVKVAIYRAGGKYVLEGGLEASLQVMCDRCLDSYRRDVSLDFRVVLAPPPPNMERTEIELLEEDMEIHFISGEEIDLDEIIKEQIYLSMPLKSLCREECLGLCPICGSNLNNGGCTCKKEQGHPSFLKLKSLQIERD